MEVSLEAKAQPCERDFSLRLTPAFLDGVLLTGGAIEDAVVVYSGATCIDERARSALMNHDYGQTLIQAGARTRLITTFSDYSIASMGTSSIVEATVGAVRKTRRPGLIILAELSRITLAGEDLRGLAQSLSSSGPVVAATSRSLRRDYSDAFSSILCGIAAAVPERAIAPEPGRAAVIGYFFDRHEGDHAGNVGLLCRMLRALGLRPAPPWLSGCGMAGLSAAGKAELLLALPDGLAAAQVLSRRSGAKVVPVGLPVGLDGTARWLRQVAAAAGRQDRAERYIKAELGRVVARLDWLADKRLAGRRAAIYAAPEWLDGLAESFEKDLGLEIVLRRPRRRAAEGEGLVDEQDPRRRVDPSVATLCADLERLGPGGLELVVGSSWESHAASSVAGGPVWIEFGYPSLRRHFLQETPHLGFSGALTWAERLAEAARDPC